MKDRFYHFPWRGRNDGRRNRCCRDGWGCGVIHYTSSSYAVCLDDACGRVFLMVGAKPLIHNGRKAR